MLKKQATLAQVAVGAFMDELEKLAAGTPGGSTVTPEGKLSPPVEEAAKPMREALKGVPKMKPFTVPKATPEVVKTDPAK